MSCCRVARPYVWIGRSAFEPEVDEHSMSLIRGLGPAQYAQDARRLTVLVLTQCPSQRITQRTRRPQIG